MSIKFKFSNALYRGRTKLGYTQQKTADKVNIGKRYYQKLEKGESLPSTDVFLNLVYLFDIDVKELREEAGKNDIEQISNNKNKAKR